jgi:hypothetical protein
VIALPLVLLDSCNCQSLQCNQPKLNLCSGLSPAGAGRVLMNREDHLQQSIAGSCSGHQLLCCCGAVSVMQLCLHRAIRTLMSAAEFNAAALSQTRSSELQTRASTICAKSVFNSSPATTLCAELRAAAVQAQTEQDANGQRDTSLLTGCTFMQLERISPDLKQRSQ